MITKALIEARAAQCGFKVIDYANGPGTRCDVNLKDERSDNRATIGVWPDTTEADLFALLARTAQELRASGYNGSSSDWMM